MTPLNILFADFIVQNFVMSWLQPLLNQVVSYNPSHERYYQDKFDTPLSFLELVDSSPPSQDIYTMNSGGSSIYKYNKMTGRLCLS